MAGVRGGVSLSVTHFEFVLGVEVERSLGDGQSLGFIDFFPSPLFVRSVQTADLKDLRPAATTRTPRPHPGGRPPRCFFFLTSEGRRRG